MARSRYDAPADRSRLNELGAEVSTIVEKFLDYDPLLDASFDTVRRRCGNSRCHCAQGEPHETPVLRYKLSGRRRLRKSDRALRKKFGPPVRRYRGLRRLRSRLRELHREILACCDRLRDHRLAEGRKLLKALEEK